MSVFSITAYSIIQQLRNGNDDALRGPIMKYYANKEEIESEENRNMDLYVTPNFETYHPNELIRVSLNHKFILSKEQMEDLKWHMEDLKMKSSNIYSHPIYHPFKETPSSWFNFFSWNQKEKERYFTHLTNIILLDDPSFTLTKMIFNNYLGKKVENVTSFESKVLVKRAFGNINVKSIYHR